MASAVFWAFAVVLFKLAGERVPPFALNLFKNLIALLFFIPLVAIAGESFLPPITTREFLLVAGSGVIGITLADTLFFAALNRLGAGLNAVVDCFYAPSMIALGVLFLGDRLTGPAVLGAILVGGAVLIGSAGRPVAGRTRRDVTTGFLLGIAGMILLAICVVMIKPVLDRERAIWITTVRLAAGTVVLVPIVLFGPERKPFLRLLRPSRTWRLTVPASILGGTLAMAAWLAAFSRMDVSAAAILNQLSTIFIFVLAAIVLREPLTFRRIAAVALAFAGALLSLQ